MNMTINKYLLNHKYINITRKSSCLVLVFLLRQQIVFTLNAKQTGANFILLYTFIENITTDLIKYKCQKSKFAQVLFEAKTPWNTVFGC